MLRGRHTATCVPPPPTCRLCTSDWKKADKKPVKNVDLWKKLLTLMEPHRVTFEWVKGHDGNPLNERCDSLATTAADGEDLLVDEQQ